MTHKHNALILTLGISTLLLSSCSGVKNSLGLDKQAPDEFAVITRAPLEVPSALVLPPPQPGMPRPQEASAINQAQEVLLGNTAKQQPAQTSSSENALLQKTGADNADPTIRAKINAETKELEERNIPVAKKLLNLGGSKVDASATVVDAKKEHERIKKNWEEGKSVTDGETPTIEE